MYLFPEHEKLLLAVVPAVIGTEHFVVLPHVRVESEPCGGKVAAVLQAGGFDEGGVHVHVHLVIENEQLGLGVVGAQEALYHLPVLVPHGPAVLENCHGVLGVVVKVPGAKSVVVLVYKLHKVSAETRQVLVHYILQRIAGKGGAVLDYSHVPNCVNYIGAYVPISGVAEKVGVVMKELCRPRHLPEALPVLFQELGAFGLQEQHFILPHKGR